jgi:NAD(P)-dependent dehydrogenase (short-subunit alcohol dehydrogenase family)
MENRVALVAGGSGFLGMTMAETIAEAGANLVILDLDKDKVNIVAERLVEKYGGNHKAIAIDLEDKDSIDLVHGFIEDHFNQLDVLINCAALVGDSSLKGWARPFEEQSISTWEKAINVNLTGAFYLIQQCKNLMEKSEVPSIINVSSIYGVAGQKMSMYKGMDYLTPAAYSASKGAIIQLTRYLATVFAPHIRVNCISPGGIARGQDKEFVDRYKELTPLSRMAIEEDFKGVTHFLASDLSAYITGQNIIVDGGWTL